MALIQLGPLAARVSGSIGGTVFSHNRGGQYARQRVAPTRVQTLYTSSARDALAACARAWGSLTNEQRQAWREYSIANPVVNRIGMSKTLSGHMAFNAINTRVLQGGGTSLDLPPLVGPPEPLGSASIALSATASTAVVTFANTPLGAGKCLWLWAAVAAGPGASYFGNRWRLVYRSDAAQATGPDVWDDLVGRFGSIQVGQYVGFNAQVLDQATGLVSAFLRCDEVAV